MFHFSPKKHNPTQSIATALKNQLHGANQDDKGLVNIPHINFIKDDIGQWITLQSILKTFSYIP